jgi:uracil-DNA glycosylase
MDYSIDKSWDAALQQTTHSPSGHALHIFLDDAYKKEVVFPARADILKALQITPLESLQVVLLGQDPYHGQVDGVPQAHGLAFSVRRGVAAPPSLKNIFKELHSDLGLVRLETDLSDWAQQGVLLLNSILTVKEGTPTSHAGKGWEEYTDALLRTVHDSTKNTVFILWGAYAQKKGAQIDRSRHLVLEAAHPSPLSAYRGFFGSKPFSKTNTYLATHGKKPIDWI